MKRNRSGFTLVEMLVVIVIIGIMASLAFGALQLAREAAHEQATKATIAKLNNIMLRKLDSYKTRRMPVRIEPCPLGLTPAQQKTWYNENQWKRLNALRDTMRMEMPERWPDVENPPVTFTTNGANWSVPEPAVYQLYRAAYAACPSGVPGPNYSHAKCLFMIVSMGNPEAMEQFHQSEIAVDPDDGLQYFVDGWGKPIYFLRWAPGCSYRTDLGFSGYSQIQSGDPDPRLTYTDVGGVVRHGDHDPFDSRCIDHDAFALSPLIFSYGRSGATNVNMGQASYYGNPGATGWTKMDPFTPLDIGQALDSSATGNITNHTMDQR